MFPNLIINHIKRYNHWSTEPSPNRKFLGLYSGMFNKWYTFVDLEAKYNFIPVKIEAAFCSLKQKSHYTVQQSAVFVECKIKGKETSE